MSNRDIISITLFLSNPTLFTFNVHFPWLITTLNIPKLPVKNTWCCSCELAFCCFLCLLLCSEIRHLTEWTSLLRLWLNLLVSCDSHVIVCIFRRTGDYSLIQNSLLTKPVHFYWCHKYPCKCHPEPSVYQNKWIKKAHSPDHLMPKVQSFPCFCKAFLFTTNASERAKRPHTFYNLEDKGCWSSLPTG